MSGSALASIGVTLFLACALLWLNKDPETIPVPPLHPAPAEARADAPVRLEQVSLPAPPGPAPIHAEEVQALQTPSPPLEPTGTAEPGKRIEDKQISKQEAVARGRSLLRVMEHGDEEMVRIIWPADQAARDSLYDGLVRGLGMVTVLIDDQFAVYTIGTAPGTGEFFDRDRFSGIIRTPEGILPAEEQKILQTLRQRHRHARSPLTVARLFPRKSDAMILGAMNALDGSDQGGPRTLEIDLHPAGLSLRAANGETLVIGF